MRYLVVILLVISIGLACGFGMKIFKVFRPAVKFGQSFFSELSDVSRDRYDSMADSLSDATYEIRRNKVVKKLIKWGRSVKDRFETENEGSVNGLKSVTPETLSEEKFK